MEGSSFPAWGLVLLAGTAAQILKFVLYGVANRRLHLRAAVTANGFPSLYGVVFGCLATSVALVEGIESSFYNAAMIYSVIVLHDAMRVKGRVGESGRAALLLAGAMDQDDPVRRSWHHRVLPLLSDRHHRPWHVMGGVLLGVLAGLMGASALR